ncbi:MAG: carboxypeptidase regulatory-like domain-containing protein, partial [Betaproteobacteria bacterium]
MTASTGRALASAALVLAIASPVVNASDRADEDSTAVTAPAASDARTGALHGQVDDPSGAAVPAARVEVTGPAGRRAAKTDGQGTWSIERLRPGRYSVVVTREGFEAAAHADVVVVAGRETAVDTALALAPVKETLTVTESRPPLGLSPDQAAGAIVIEGAELDALPDDPDELADALQALAGSAAGPNGGQIFVDGFSGGRLPPKSAIRQIRLNASPFSAEYDRPGFGRIEIFTRPGSESYRGQASARFNDSALNTRDPFATSKPDYRRLTWSADLGGPLVKGKSSFFVDFERRSIDDAQLVNATVLGPGYVPVPFNDTLVVPQRRTSVSPRLDAQLGASHTLTLRYAYTTTDQPDAGIGGFSLPSHGYEVSSTQHVVQLGDTAVLGKLVNELRAQWTRQDRSQASASPDPTLQVQDAFTGGGSGAGLSTHGEDRLELHDIASWSAGAHSLRTGFRLRGTRQSDVSRQGFNGTVTFAGTLGPALDAAGQPLVDADGRPVLVPVSSIERYRRTLLLGQLGLAPALVRQLGGGASQLQVSGGDPYASVRQWDLGAFLQDDWKARPDLTLGLGLRLESQTNLGSDLDLAPRFSASWSPGYQGRGTPKTVVRAGAGVFYDRVDDSLVLEARRFDGSAPKRFLVSDPAVLDLIAFDAEGNVASLPSFDALGSAAQPQVVRELAGLSAPATLQLSLGLDRTLPGNFTANATWIHSSTWRALRSRVVEAAGAAGASGVAYQYESTGHLRQDHLVLGLNRRFDERLSVSVRYFLGWDRSDTDGAGSFPASSSQPDAEWGRASNDVRQRLVLLGSLMLPGDVRLSPFLIASSGGP